MLDPLRLFVISTVLAWIGLSLVFARVRWFRRAPLTQRLLPYAGGAVSQGVNPALQTMTDALMPVASAIGERVARIFGVQEDLETRLRRAHFDTSAGNFRMRQFTYAVGATCAGLLFAVALALPPLLTLAFAFGAPLLAFLLLEQQLISAIQQRQSRLFAELPVVSEQLATLLSAGYSLGSALSRLAERNRGVSGDDLRDVCARMRQGLTTADALREWSENAALPELDRLVTVLAFSSETSDLGRLVSGEAKAMRQESQRRLAELIDKRAQQVWVPVTVATLIPGVVFLAIPFLQALRQFSAN